MKTIFSVVFAFIFYFTQCQDSWVRKADFPNFRYEAAAFSIGDFGYVGTGMTSGKLENDFWKYSPATDTWVEIDSLPGLDRIGAISFAINGKGYAGGGNADMAHDEMPLYDFWEYDTSTNNWTQKADIPFQIISVGTTTSFATGNKGYVVRHFGENEFWEYNPETDTWAKKADYPGEAHTDFASFGNTKKGYIGTGFDGSNNTSEFWEYDPVSDSWAQKADFPGLPRNNAIAFNINDKGYLGLGTASGPDPKDFWEYNPENDTWTAIADCGIAATGAVAFNIGLKGYVGTGLFMEDSEIWEYSPLTSSVNLLIEDSFIEIFPNPVTNGHVKFDFGNEAFGHIQVFDCKGNIVDFSNIEGRSYLYFAVEKYPPGIYFYIATHTSGIVRTGMFVVQ